MGTSKAVRSATGAFAVFVAGSLASAAAQQAAGKVTAAQIDSKSIGGVVTSRFGREAGVWVIAETRDLATKFAKIVVTDDFGRYVIPDLPQANYKVWVRGYGLVDSPKTDAVPGRILDLRAVVAPSLAAAAQYYPAIYWYSMLKIPDPSLFPGTGPDGNGMPVGAKSQGAWVNMVNTNGCVGCHQLGDLATRTIPPALGHFDNAIEAWARRIQSGPAGLSMVRTTASMMTPQGGELAALANWTDRIKAGELPSQSPPRPTGIERNLVVTVRDWSDPKHYLHDLISSDKRNPTVNANGPVYGATELSTPHMPVLDPVHDVKTTLDMPTADPKHTPSSAQANPILAASPYFGTEQVWDSKVNAHSLTMDQDGRVWWTAQTRAPTHPPAFCSKGGGNPSADYFPQDQKQAGSANRPPYKTTFVQNARQVTMYDPKTKKFSFVDTCFNTQHLNFAEDADNALWLGGNSNGIRAVVGWIDTKLFLETGDAGKSQGWTPLIVDTVGDGKPHAWTEPGQPTEPDKDVRLGLGFYAVSYSPADGSIWGSNLTYPGYIIRLAPGSNPPRTARTEIYKVPLPGFGIRGADVDRQGVVWVPLDSGYLGGFDRRKCKGPLNGPGAEKGDRCPEGWAFYRLPGPSFQGRSGAAESPYYTWVDQHDTLGLGDDVPLVTGNQSDSIDALVGGHMVELSVPYPMGLFAKWLDGRIDDPKGGWKGRGLWVTSGTRTPAHIEGIDASSPGAPGATPATLSSPLVFQFQMRPEPLAH